MINKTEIERTNSLSEATEKIFGVYPYERVCFFPGETMSGEIAQEYDTLGKKFRQETYRKIARDFRVRTKCYSSNHEGRSWPNVGTIVEVGCGSGLLSIALAEETNGSILGIDISEDMLNLAKENLKGKDDLVKKIKFRRGSVYDLQTLVHDIKDINYIVCRNVLHRLKDPSNAIVQMYSVLNSKGKMYIRDLRRDANWETIKKRIGEQRWKNPELVKDYIGAMAQTLTLKEFVKLFEMNQIPFDNIWAGQEARYLLEKNSPRSNSQEEIKEFEEEMDFVCVVSKE